MLNQISKKIWDVDGELQSAFLYELATQHRNVPDFLVDKVVADWKSEGMFVVPYSSYIAERCGLFIKQNQFGLYQGDFCYLAERLAMPLKTFNGEVIGFVGYSKVTDEDLETDTEGNFLSIIGSIKYRYPSSLLFDKSRYLYMSGEEWINAYNTGAVVIVDGLFDKRMLNLIGIPACSLCGSNLTIYHKEYLKRIPRKIVIADNDTAGRQLYRDCKNAFGAVELINRETKDIDEFLCKHPNNVQRLLECWEEMKKGGWRLSRSLSSKPLKSYTIN